MKIISLSIFRRLLADPLPMERRSEQTNFPRGNSPIQFVERRNPAEAPSNVIISFAGIH